MVLREDDTLAALSVGFQPFDSLEPILDAWVSGEMSVKKQVEAARAAENPETTNEARSAISLETSALRDWFRTDDNI